MKWSNISNLILFILAITVGYNSLALRSLTQTTDLTNEYMLMLEEQIFETQIQLEKTAATVENLDQLINKDLRKKSRINTVVAAIKTTLPPGGVCPEFNSSELLRVATSVVDLSERYAVKASLILAIIRQESAFCRNAVSPVGAQGYMQLMPDTAAEVARQIGASLHVWSSRDNIHLGTAYISTLLMTFSGNVDLAVKAYNGGPTHVKKVEAKMLDLHEESADYAIKVQDYMQLYETAGVTW